MAIGIFLWLLGFAGTVIAITQWGRVGFGGLDDANRTIRLVMVSATAIALGTMGIFAGLFTSLLTLRTTRLHPVADDADDDLVAV